MLSLILEVASLLIIYGAYGIISCTEIPYPLIKVVYMWIFYVITASIIFFAQTMVLYMLKDACVGDIGIIYACFNTYKRIRQV